MKVNNSGSSVINVKRGDYSLIIPVGVSVVPDYDWIASIVKKNSNISFVNDISISKKGTIKKRSVNTKKKVSKKPKND